MEVEMWIQANVEEEEEEEEENRVRRGSYRGDKERHRFRSKRKTKRS